MGLSASAHGLTIGTLPTGPLGSITDVPGIHVGHTTLSDGDIRSGVTAIVPTQLDERRHTLPAAVAVGNGHGKLVGSTQVDELGTLETAILLTSTLSVHRVADALLTHELTRPGREQVVTVNPLVGETNDAYLSDIRTRPVRERHVLDALASARPGPVDEGCVGAGTGTCALGFKGGIGTASRVAREGAGGWTVGALVQSNFGGTLRIDGVRMPSAELLEGIAPSPAETTGVADAGDSAAAAQATEDQSRQGNSCMIVVVTDAPVDARQLSRVARRAIVAMDRVGADFAHGSGDYAIAFSTSADAPPMPDPELNPVFAATMEAVEEALVSSLVHAVTTTGYRGHTAYALPLDRVLERLSASGRLPTA
jgi:D-aminopeptidase